MPRGRRFDRGQRRRLIWARENAQAIVTDASQVVGLTTDFEAQLGSDVVGVTTRRLILDLQALTNTVATPTASNFIHYGVLVANQDVGSNLTASGLTGAAGVHRDWIVYGMFGPSVGLVGAVGGEFSVHVDIGTGRKMDEVNLGLFLVMEANTGGNYTVQVKSNTLLALP